jgi:sodium/hydrogen exchanger 3
MFLGIFLCLGVVIFGFLLVYMLRRYSVSWFPEAWAFFGLGLCIAGVSTIGLLPGLHGVVEQLRHSFPNLFFVALLPVIIFESGVSLDKQPFFANFGAILLYAFVGTFVSSVVVGLTMWALGAVGGMYEVRILDALTFGAIISATDPVTVLTVFQELGVDRTLYALIFGESVLNDAVAIVLLHSLLTFQTQDASLGSAASAVLGFTVVFAGSLLIGVGVGVIGALLFKHVSLRARHRPIERVLFTVLPFIAYMLAEAMRLSGVVAILFTGITTSHYTARNVTPSTRRFSRVLFRLLASVAEALVFVSIGVATPPILSRVVAANNVSALWMSLLAVALGRYANVRLCTAMANSTRPADTAINAPAPFVLWFSGLRGGVAFALAASARSTMTDQTWAELQETVCLFVVVITMTTIGGTVGPVARVLGLSERLAPTAAATEQSQIPPNMLVPGQQPVRDDTVRARHNYYDPAAPSARIAVDGTRFTAGGREVGEAASSDGDQAKPKRWTSSRRKRQRAIAASTVAAGLDNTTVAAGDAAIVQVVLSDAVSEVGGAAAADAGFGSGEDGAGQQQAAAGSVAASDTVGTAADAVTADGSGEFGIVDAPGRRAIATQADEAVDAAVLTLRATVLMCLVNITAVIAVVLRSSGLGLGSPAELALGVRHADGTLMSLWTAMGLQTMSQWCRRPGGGGAICRRLQRGRGARYSRIAGEQQDSSSDAGEAATSRTGQQPATPPKAGTGRRASQARGSTADLEPRDRASRTETGDHGRLLPVAVPAQATHHICDAEEQRASMDSRQEAAAAEAAEMSGDQEAAARAPATPTAARAGGGTVSAPLTVGEALRRREASSAPNVVQSFLQAAPSLQDLARFESRVLTPLFTSAAGHGSQQAAIGDEQGLRSQDIAAAAAAAATDAGDTTAMEGEGASDDSQNQRQTTHEP